MDLGFRGFASLGLGCKPQWAKGLGAQVLGIYLWFQGLGVDNLPLLSHFTLNPK